MNNKLIQVSLKPCPLSLHLIAIDPFPFSTTPVCSQHTPHSLNIIQPPQWLQWRRADHIFPFSNINHLCHSKDKFVIVVQNLFKTWTSLPHMSYFKPYHSNDTSLPCPYIHAHIIYSAWNILSIFTSPRLVWLIPHHHSSLNSLTYFFFFEQSSLSP